jgi:hypothetical protein
VTAVDDLWDAQSAAYRRTGVDWAPVTRDELDGIARASAAEALQKYAREVGTKLEQEYLGPAGKADDWTGHRRKVWAEGVSTALACIRRAGGAIAHGRADL